MMRDFSADVTLSLDALFVSQTIRLHLAGILEHRDVALRVVSAACKLIPPQPNGQPWSEFQAQVVSAVSEAFNNVVLHGYADMPAGEGMIDLAIELQTDGIRVEMRDWGASFDPTEIPDPELDALPESGLGLYIMRSFMDVAYLPGHPNLLTLSKRIEPIRG
jgi:serine/threonine-protein kinase RsbW